MPDFFPFEAVEALVSDRLQRFDLALDRNVSSSREHVLAVFAAADRVFQMGMPNPRTELLHCKLWLFIRCCESMMRVPKQCDVIGAGGLQNIFQRCR